VYAGGKERGDEKRVMNNLACNNLGNLAS